MTAAGAALAFIHTRGMARSSRGHGSKVTIGEGEMP